MLGPDMGMPELPSRLLRVANNLAGGLCEPFEHQRQASHHSQGLTSGAATEESILGQRARMPGFRLGETGGGCLGPVSPTAGPALQGRFALFPSPAGSVPRPAARPAFWAYVNHRIPTRREPQNERISSRS